MAVGDEDYDEALINNFYLNEIAVNYQKGCFLGQETAAKIHYNRGGASYPALIHIGNLPCEATPGERVYSNEKEIGTINTIFIEKDETFIQVALKREFLINKTRLEVSLNNVCYDAVIHLYPYFTDTDNTKKSKTLLNEGIELFQDDLNDEAITLIRQAINLDPRNGDAYESLGVILGRISKFEEAIELMDKLVEIDPKSIMAHSNKSLYLMKLGRINEAEEEKALATVKTFEKLGREANEKKAKEKEELKIKRSYKERENMFQEVLEIDENDEFANIQLASIKIKLGDFEYIKEKFKFLELNFPNNPEMYLILVTYLKNSNQKGEEFKRLLSMGIELAAKKGNAKLINAFNHLR